jgi:hypothetical protein
MSEKFRVGLTRDFLDDKGNLAYKDIGLKLLYDNPMIILGTASALTPFVPARSTRRCWPRKALNR